MAGTSYTRQSTLSDGNIITAALFNNEFNQILNAFAYASTGTTGHQHDGGAGEGGNIAKIGDQDFLNKIEVDSTNNRIGLFVQVSSGTVEQVRIQDGAIVPVTDSDIDLGTSSVRFKAAYLDTIDVANLTITDDTTFVGTTAANKITFDKSLNALHFADDMAISLGGLSASPGDLRIYHDGDNSYIKELGTGNLFIQGDANVNIGSNNASASLSVSSTGTVFRGSNSTVATLTTTGMKFEDGKIISVGDDDDLQIYHDSNNSYIKDAGTGNLNIIASTDVFVGTDNSTMANFDSTGPVDLYHNNSKKFETTSAGASITGTATASTGLTVGDATSSLQLTHDGNNSYIKHVHSAGTLRVPTRSFAVRNAADNKTLIRAVEGDTAELYHDGQKKIETTDTGTLTTGVHVASAKVGIGLKDYGDGNGNVPLLPLKPFHVYSATTDVTARLESGDIGAGLELIDNTTTAVIRADNGVLKLSSDSTNAAAGSHIELYVDGSLAAEVLPTGLDVTGTINATTAIDTPSIEVTTLKARDGTAAGSIADSTGIVTLDNGLSLPTDKIIKLGDTGAMEIFHNGTNSVIREQGPGALSLRGNEVTIKNYAGTKTLAYFTQDLGVELYYNNVKTLETVDGGALVTGTLNVSTGDMTITSESPEIYLVDTSQAGAQGRVSATSSGLSFRSRASDDSGTAQFGNHTFSRFDGTDTKTQMVLDTNNDMLVWNDAGAVRLFWDASHNSSGGGLAVGQAAVPEATLDVHGDALIKERLQIGESQGGTTSQAALDIRGNNADVGEFVASVSAGVMTVASVNGATLAVGDVIYSANAIPANTFIKSFDTGSGGTGTYNLSQSFDLPTGTTLRSSAKGSLTASFTNADTSLRAGQPLGTIEFNDADGTNDGAKGFLVCGSQDTTPSSYLAFGTHHTGQGEHAREVARLDEDGNFLLNTIISNNTLDHVELRADGEIKSAGLATTEATVTGTTASTDDSPLTVNRVTNDGAILALQQDGTDQLKVYSTSGNRPIIVGEGDKGFKITPDSIQPRTSTNAVLNGVMDLGNSTSKFKDLYLGGGVYLGGTGADNKLDDYEEGDWTPAYTTAATQPTVAYNSTGGFYTKVGRLVTVTGRIRTASVDNSPDGTDAAGGLRISGLPFVISTAVTELQNGTLHCGQIKSFTSGRFPAGAYAVRGSSEFALTRRGSSSGNMVNLDAYNAGASNFTLNTGSNANEIVFSAIYYTDA